MARSKVVSIQAKAKRGNKSHSAKLQAETLRSAGRNGLPWEDFEVSRIIAGIEKDETSYELAKSLGRTYYSTMSTRRMVAFALRHSAAIYGTGKKR